MLNRRNFIKTSVLAGALPALTAMPFSHANDPAILTISDGACSAMRAFARARGTPVYGVDAAHRGGAFAANKAHYWCGLTRDSDYFILAQLAARHGYRSAYVGVHDYRDGTLHHRFRGAHHALVLLSAAITTAPAQWPQLLAHAVPLLVAGETSDQQIELRSALTRPADSGGYLVSWCLHAA